MRLGGAPIADLFAATTGTDSDWVVKLIDVFPDEVPTNPKWAATNFPSRWISSAAATAKASSVRPPSLPAQQQRYRFALPTVNHVFLPGHRIMVQIQSSWFPLYDRNPQTLRAEHFLRQAGGLREGDADRYSRSANQPSAVWLPVAQASQTAR